MGHDYKNIRVKHFLTHWKMLEQNVNNLKPHEIEMGKLLFNSLPKLSEKSRNLLKIKYYDSPNVACFDKERAVYTSTMPINDDVVAFNLGVTIEQYRIDRRLAEKELKELMLQAGQEILYSKDKIFLKINRFLYIKHVDIKMDYFLGKYLEVGDITLTGNHILDEKQVFDLSDDVIRQGVEKLENYGFQREALDKFDLEEYENEQ
ncbi:hypothetical protein ACODGR_03195 [Vagococcus fluvialis]|uniref:hypothetical protein n=1 Tax=Vagococcus fluvialis TaxID=2738 RepID=UPI003B220F55